MGGHGGEFGVRAAPGVSPRNEPPNIESTFRYRSDSDRYLLSFQCLGAQFRLLTSLKDCTVREVNKWTDVGDRRTMHDRRQTTDEGRRTTDDERRTTNERNK